MKKLNINTLKIFGLILLALRGELIMNCNGKKIIAYLIFWLIDELSNCILPRGNPSSITDQQEKNCYLSIRKGENYLTIMMEKPKIDSNKINFPWYFDS